VADEETDSDADIGRELLGRSLRERREEAGYTRRRLAELSGASFETLYSVETGRRLPSLGTLLKLSRVYRVAPRDLLSGVFPWDGDSRRPADS
jgi:transcriptional regulator with XRE-family HTH domain